MRYAARCVREAASRLLGGSLFSKKIRSDSGSRNAAAQQHRDLAGAMPERAVIHAGGGAEGGAPNGAAFRDYVEKLRLSLGEPASLTSR